jgi:hypothetical protein
MSQPPYPGQGLGYAPGTGPGYPPPPGQGFGQPPRRGKPWWVWALFGCGGCALLAAIGIAVVAALGVNTYQSAMQDIGTVTEASVQQSLGSDLPAYPNAKLDLDSTKILVTSFRVGEKLGGKAKGSIFGGAALYRSPDSPQKVMESYDKTLKKSGWQALKTQDSSFQQQHQFQKAGGVAIVQTQNDPSSGGTQLTIMRGGSELVELNRRQGGSHTPSQ